MDIQPLAVSPELLRRYDRPGPRYTSYPTAPQFHASFGEAESRKTLTDEKATRAKRGNAAFQLAWLKRQDRPIEIGCLDFGGTVFVLHLPGEAFIEYQLAAQKMRPDKAVFVASYGDDGCGYIPTASGYLQGGYEPTVALAGPQGEAILLQAMAKLLKAKVPE